MGVRAVFVIAAVDDQCRAAQFRQHITQIPVFKLGMQPGIDPGIQHPACLVAVVLAEALHLHRILEQLARLLNALHRAVFTEGLRRHRDQPEALLRIARRTVHHHAATHTVAEQDELRQADMRDQGRKIIRGLACDEVQRQGRGVGIRAAEAQPVIGDHRAAGCGAQRLRKAAPQLDAAERIVKQDDRPLLLALSGAQVRTNRRPCVPGICWSCTEEVMAREWLRPCKPG